jgi:uncharacterized protein YfbU (UPF0304 family)
VPTITLRVDDQTKHDLDALARSRRSTVTDVLRPLIDEAIGRSSDRAADHHPVNLTLAERRILSLLHAIMGKLDPGSEEDHRLRAEVLDAGYAAEYSNEFISVEPELTVRDCEFVWDILDMFLMVKTSIKALPSDTLAELPEHAESFLTFDGFDLNDTHEAKLLSYARYLLATGRWTDLATHFDDEHERGNSHSLRVSMYRRMLDVYKPLFKAKTEEWGRGPERYLLDVDELAAIAEAAIHPDNRRAPRA